MKVTPGQTLNVPVGNLSGVALQVGVTILSNSGQVTEKSNFTAGTVLHEFGHTFDLSHFAPDNQFIVVVTFTAVNGMPQPPNIADQAPISVQVVDSVGGVTTFLGGRHAATSGPSFSSCPICEF